MSEKETVVARKPQTMREWLDSYQNKFMEAIPENTIGVARFITAASLEIQANPKLQKCDKVSLFQSLLESARYGLEVGRLLGQAWLIPYNDTKYMPDGSRAKVMTCHFQLGYKGLIVLARRSQTIKTITAEVVYENDQFEVELGQGRHLTHRIDIREERGEPIAYYCLVELENGGAQFSVMTKKDAEHHRDRYSKADRMKKEGEDSVWDTNFDEMALKTVVIKTLKLCPISVEALEAASREEIRDETRGERNVTPTAEVLPPPPDQGEIEKEPVEEPVQIKAGTIQPQEPIKEPPQQTTAQKALNAALKVGNSTSLDNLKNKIGSIRPSDKADFPATQQNQQTADDLDIF